MKIYTNKCCVGLFCLFFSGLAHAETSLWKISKNNHHLYLGGTVHILAASDYPLPAAFEKAYQSSHKLVFETDVEKLQSPEFQQLMLQKLTYRDGKTLADVLSVQTYQRLESYCTSRGISLDSIHAFKPGLVTSVLLLAELQRLGMSGVGVDEFFSSESRQDNKPVGQLETVEEQLYFLGRMGQGQEDEFFEYSLSDIDNLQSLMKSMKKAWRTGDMKELQRVAIEPYIDEFPRPLEKLLDHRNTSWIPKIEAMLETEEVEFILVGVLHFVGEQGLLNQLKTRGYSVEQY